MDRAGYRRLAHGTPKFTTHPLQIKDLRRRFEVLLNSGEAPEPVLEEAGIVLGEDYPFPIVDLKASREHALAAYASVKDGAPSS